MIEDANVDAKRARIETQPTARVLASLTDAANLATSAANLEETGGKHVQPTPANTKNELVGETVSAGTSQHIVSGSQSVAPAENTTELAHSQIQNALATEGAKAQEVSVVEKIDVDGLPEPSPVPSLKSGEGPDKHIDPGGVVQPAVSGPIKSIGAGNLNELFGHMRNDDRVWAFNETEGGIDVLVLTYVFPQSADDVPLYWQQKDGWADEMGNFLPISAGIYFEPFGAEQQSGALAAMKQWEDMANVRFEPAEGDVADVYFYGFNGAAETWGATSNAQIVDDELVDNRIRYNSASDNWDDMSLSSAALNTMIHEVGHTLGLQHPGHYDSGDGATYDADAEYIQDTDMYTVMSYFDGTNTGADYAGFNNNQDTPRSHDAWVIQDTYGANWQTRQFESTYGYNASAVQDVYDFTVNTSPILTIWDGGGEDWLDLSGDASGVSLNLNPGAFSSTHGMTNNISIAYVPAGASQDHEAYIENAVGGAGDDTLIGNAQDNILKGGDGGDELAGMSGDDQLFGEDGDDTLSGGFGLDYFNGGEGTDTISFTYSSADWSVWLGINTDTKGHVHGQAVYGSSTEQMVDIENARMGSGNDFVVGSSLANRLEGRDGNDTLLGGAGDDDLVGGNGNDILTGGTGLDHLNGGNGFDTADYRTSTKAWSINLKTGEAFGFNQDFDTLHSIEAVQAGFGNDIVSGNSDANYLFGNEGDDYLAGQDGDDFLNGGAGNDTIVGGSGFDMASYIGAQSATFVDLAISGPQDTQSSGHDSLIEIEKLFGSMHDDWLFGDAGNNTLNGWRGNDVLTGREGVDWLWGDEGNDILLGGEGMDFLFGGVGMDTAAYTFAGSDVWVNLSIVGQQDTNGNGLDQLDGIENLSGSAFNDVLIGDDQSNILTGFLGNDFLNGQDGGDALQGGQGNDTLIGGQGNDVMDGGEGSDWASYSIGSTSSVVVDLKLAVQNTIGAGVDTLIQIENLKGSHFDDFLSGNIGANIIEAGGGADWVFGGDGNDTLNGEQGDDALFGGQGNDVLNGGSGNDWFQGDDGDDTFVFDGNWGQDVISDFGPMDDVIDFTNVAGFESPFDLEFNQIGSDLELSFGGNTLTLLGTQSVDLNQDNFLW